MIKESNTLFENNDITKIIKKKKSTKKNKSKNKNIIDNNNNIQVIKDEIKEKYDDLYLNNLSYEKALESDKRTFGDIYFSWLKSKNLLIYTFFSYHDHIPSGEFCVECAYAMLLFGNILLLDKKYEVFLF